MLNLLPGSIGTVEFRIKQGSNDVQENKMYMLLLAEFVESIMNLQNDNNENTMICSAYNNNKSLIGDFYNLFKLLESYKWTEHTNILFSNSVTYNKKMNFGFSLQSVREAKTDKELITTIFKTFFTLIKNKEVKSYWQNIAESLYDIGNPTVVVPMEGGREMIAQQIPQNILQESIILKNKEITESTHEFPFKHFNDASDPFQLRPLTSVTRHARSSSCVAAHAFKSKVSSKNNNIPEKMTHMSSFGLIDYDKINETMKNNKALYKAYELDMKNTKNNSV